jgi:murein DD-endopeptidase MepM/ murein hydrolase activator NlpD
MPPLLLTAAGIVLLTTLPSATSTRALSKPVSAVSAATLSGPSSGRQGRPVTFALAPPVLARIADPFRHPDCRYCAGNRGLEYAPTDGLVVRAAAPGTVGWVGSVAGVRYVVIDHTDGYRTTYGRLADATVAVGQAVEVGGQVGTAGPGLYFGLRLGDTYLDPQPFFAPGGARPRRAHLVAVVG